MATVQFRLFPDAREGNGWVKGFRALSRELEKKGPKARVFGPFGDVGPLGGSWWLYTHAIDPHAIVTTLQRCDWQHQPLLVYRSSDENTWCYLRIVRRLESLWGDEREGVKR